MPLCLGAPVAICGNLEVAESVTLLSVRLGYVSGGGGGGGDAYHNTGGGDEAPECLEGCMSELERNHVARAQTVGAGNGRTTAGSMAEEEREQGYRCLPSSPAVGKVDASSASHDTALALASTSATPAAPRRRLSVTDTGNGTRMRNIHVILARYVPPYRIALVLVLLPPPSTIALIAALFSMSPLASQLVLHPYVTQSLKYGGTNLGRDKVCPIIYLLYRILFPSSFTAPYSTFPVSSLGSSSPAATRRRPPDGMLSKTISLLVENVRTTIPALATLILRSHASWKACRTPSGRPPRSPISH